jgi:ATP-dependent protease ClpP protease subunit
MNGKIFINGIIGEDTSLIDVISQVKKHENLSSLEVEINSIGGFVDNGFEI